MSLLGQINSLLSYLPDVPIPKKKSSPVTAVIPRNSSPHCADMSSIIRLAGLSGAIGVAVGAYGAHVIRDDEKVDARRKKAFEVGSRYHLIHTLALLAAPNARYPWVTSAVFLSGIVMFCGPCYHYSITANESSRRFTPIGGVLFIIGWLTFIL
ncbi:hypothetical protein ANCCAN_02466 [Ancylostoma caninum]|uniref:DUF423 domain-containing protein n=1 Tax=Ancylostoma caninum TaxID=29170 RepID=A0A368H3Z5_ANCCA|nr:hypothetical protein ANCCAN_02466 [Ancylostoma caninum]